MRGVLVLVSIGGLLCGACRAGEQPTRVTRTDGSVLVGVLVETRTDAVVIRVDGRDLRIPLTDIRSIGRETAAPPANMAERGGGAADAPAKGGAPGGKPSDSPASVPSGGRTAATASTTPIVVPAGTRLAITMGSEVSSVTSRVSDRVEATLARPVLVGGVEALPSGVAVVGAVVESLSGERARGRGRVVLRFDRLRTPGDGEMPMQTETVRIEPAVRQRRGFGGVFDKVVRTTKGALGIEGPGGNIRLAVGSRVTVEIVQPLTVHVPAPR